MKKLFALFIAAFSVFLFSFCACAAGTTSVIPTKTLNKVLDGYRNAIKKGDAYFDLTEYGIAYDSEAYAELWLYLTGVDGDSGSIEFGKYSESYVSFTIDSNDGSGKFKGVNIEYDEHYRKEDGSCDTDLVKKDQALITERFNRSRALVNRNMSDTEKALLLYDFVISVSNYAVTDETDQFGESVYPKDAYTVTGLLRDGYGVCTAYAKLYAILLNEAGVSAFTVDSESMAHEWTMVKVDGKWYHCDPTWDDLFSESNQTALGEFNNDNWDIGAVGHKYFLKSDEEFEALDHTDWKVSYTVNPDHLQSAPASGPSGTFDNMFFSDKNDTYDCISAMNYINGYWYFADLSSDSIISQTFNGEPEAFALPDNEFPKYSFGYKDDLYVCGVSHIYRFNTLINKFEPIIKTEIYNNATDELRYFTEMNIRFDEMTVVNAVQKRGDNNGAEFEVNIYPMEEVASMEAIVDDNYGDDDNEIVSRDGEETERIPQMTRPGGPSPSSMSEEEKRLLEETQNLGKRVSSLIYLGIAAFFLIFGVIAIILAIKYNKKH